MKHNDLEKLIKPLEGKFSICFKDGEAIVLQEEMTQEEYDAI